MRAVQSGFDTELGENLGGIIIRFDIQLGMVVLPKTANPEHMKSNAAVDFVITDEDMETLKHLEKNQGLRRIRFLPGIWGQAVSIFISCSYRKLLNRLFLC